MQLHRSKRSQTVIFPVCFSVHLKKKNGSAEMTQQLRAMATLPGEPRFNFQPTCLLTTVYNSGPQGPDVLFSSLKGIRHTCGGAQTDTQANHFYTQNSMLINPTKVQFIQFHTLDTHVPQLSSFRPLPLCQLAASFQHSLLSFDVFTQLGHVFQSVRQSIVPVETYDVAQK